MAYDAVETAAYRFRLPADLPALLGTFYSFKMPEHWPGLIRHVWDHDRRHDPLWNIPVGRLNQTLRALVPDVLYTGRDLDPRAADTWLYSRQPLDTELLKRCMQAYLQEWLDARADFPELRDKVAALDIASHAQDWEPANIDSSWLGTNEAGTATLNPILYRLVPEIVAERILQLGKYDDELDFRQVATDEGAELMSWPPLTHTKPGRGGEAKISHYSAVIKVTLRTVPFDPRPRVHLGVGLRRWVGAGSKLFIPSGGSTSVYVSPSPDPATGFAGTRFAVAFLKYSKQARDYVWKSNGPAGVIESLTVGEKFPDAARIKADPGAYLPPTGGMDAAVTYHTRMRGRHGVETGIMPDERRRILTWAAGALPDAFEPALELEKAVSGRITLPRQYLEKAPDPKAPKRPEPKHEPDDLEAAVVYEEKLNDYEKKHAAWQIKHAKAQTENPVIEAENALRRRRLLAHGMDGEELRVDIIADTDVIREHLVAAAAQWLGLEPEAGATPDHVLFRDGGLRVRLICHRDGRLISPLGNGTIPKRGEAHQRAIDERATLVQEFLDGQELTSELALVEIDSPTTFTNEKVRIDPYKAIRQGAARANRVTQFITRSDGDDDVAFRAYAAWSDGIRSLGIALTPPHSDGLNLPERIEQVAFWQVRRNATAKVPHAVFMPIALLLRPGQPRVMARTPETKDWIPYNELLCKLSRTELRTDEKGDRKKRQSEEMARFMRVTLPQVKTGNPLMLLADAENLRSRWGWLTDEGLTKDRIAFGEPDPTRLATHNKRLRVVRVRTDAGRLETPTWWTPPAEKDGLSGFTSSLWKAGDADAGNRVFLSLAEKNAKLNSHNRGLRKLTSSGTKGLRPDKAAPVPRMLEITVAGLAPDDDPETAAAQWAMYVHQQRFTADFLDGRERPYALDLCDRAGDYAFPDESVADEDDAAPSGGPAEDDYEQGTLDLDL